MDPCYVNLREFSSRFNRIDLSLLSSEVTILGTFFSISASSVRFFIFALSISISMTSSTRSFKLNFLISMVSLVR